MHGVLYRLLMAFYFPFIGLVCLVAGVLAVGLLLTIAKNPCALFGLLLAGVLLLTLVQVLWTLWVVLTLPRKRDLTELRLPRKRLKKLYDLVFEVAHQRGVLPPDEIRLGAATVAHVYESPKGKKILVIGGVALAAFSEEVLAGIIAHELGHFDAGDTQLSRAGARRGMFMTVLEWRFSQQWSAVLNPLVWLIYLYHLLYRGAWAANSREQERLADQQSVRQVGKELTAVDLIYLAVTEHLPWARLTSIVESCVATNEPLSRVFAEQVRRARSTTRSEWEDALEKALRQRTGVFDSHPCLRDRLAALGVSPRKALEKALARSGSPARKLVADWDQVEVQLSEVLIAPYRDEHLEKMEIAQILRGRPIGR